MSMWLSATSLARPSAPQWLEDACQKLVENDPTFKTIELTHPRIDDACAKIFAKALDENHTATALLLSCHNIVDDGAFAVGFVLGSNRSVEKLQLRDLRNVREVKIFFNLLLKNVTITELSLRHCMLCPVGAAAVAELLRVHPALQEFRLTDTQLTGESLEIICKSVKASSTLQRIYFVNSEISGTKASHLSCMLEDNSNLRELYLCENDLGDDGVQILAQGVLGAGNHSALHHVDIRSNDITSLGALSLQGLIVSNKRLTSLNLSNNCLGNSGVAALARGLQCSSCRLERLQLSGNEIDSVGAKAVASMLRTNRSLQELDLSFNNIADEGCTVIASALACNSYLRWICLRRNSIGDVGAMTFASKLPHMSGLKELILSKNDIGREGATALLSGLRSNVELEYLHVHEKASEPISREIVHWSRLNKAGRRIFRTSVSNSLWPQVYGRISDDSHALFHFLTERPDVVLEPLIMVKSVVDTKDTSISDYPSPKRKKKRTGSLNEQ